MGGPIGGSASAMNPIRFMQIALATTIVFTVVYMGEFMTSTSLTSSSASTANEMNINLRSDDVIGETQILLQGFEAGYKFVSTYDVASQGPLYILFMSDADENGTYWCPDCQRAKKPVYDVFARAPRGSRLVEIRVGPPEAWRDDGNEFRQNELFYIDYIPTLIKYDGAGNSSHMLNEQYTTDYDLLEYVFDVPSPAAGPPNKNKIVTLDEATAVEEYVQNYDNSYPLFLFLVSGKHSFNGRLWCPYCDRAHVAVKHYFNYSAPDSAVMIEGIVSHSYKMWKKKSNPFKQAHFKVNVVAIRGVPYLGRVIKDPETNRVRVEEFAPDFHEKLALIKFFGGDTT